MMKRIAAALLLSVPLLVAGAETTEAFSIHVINSGVQGNVGVVSAVTQLTALGHTVTTGATLTDYTAFDQVWDLRYNASLVAADITAFDAYLEAGGSVYVTGENPSFDALRNNSMVAFFAGVGAGSLTYDASVASNTQTFTAEGAALNTPNVFSSLSLVGARSVSGAGSGFLVTESSPGAGAGSMVAWDFGDIAGASNGRMIALWDIDVFRSTTGNGQDWTQNMVTYLGGEPPVSPPVESVPEPATLLLLGSGMAALMALRKRLHE